MESYINTFVFTIKFYEILFCFKSQTESTNRSDKIIPKLLDTDIEDIDNKNKLYSKRYKVVILNQKGGIFLGFISFLFVKL